jgi:hypothetical protein
VFLDEGVGVMVGAKARVCPTQQVIGGCLPILAQSCHLPTAVTDTP